MSSKQHGLAIGIAQTGNEFFLTLKATGTLTHADYQTISPMLDAALGEVKTPRVKVLVDCTELEGWELRAAWDDFKLGLKHGNEFEKIAIVGNKHWLEVSAKTAGWFTSGEAQYFERVEDAYAWLNA